MLHRLCQGPCEGTSHVNFEKKEVTMLCYQTVENKTVGKMISEEQDRLTDMVRCWDMCVLSWGLAEEWVWRCKGKDFWKSCTQV